MKVIIADEQECSLTGVTTLFTSGKGISLAGKARNGTELMQLIKTCSPDIVVIDIALPLLNGIEGVTQLVAKYPCMAVIVFTGYEECCIIEKLVQAGVRGCVSKNRELDELEWAILTVADGGTYFCTTTQHTLKHIESYGSKFSKRQLEILPYIWNGKSDEEIGDKLCISRRTVEGHRNNIKSILHVQTNAEITYYTLLRGYHYITHITGILAWLCWLLQPFLGDIVCVDVPDL